MNEACITLVARMVVDIMAGDRQRVIDLYEQYRKERYLHVSVGEILKAKKGMVA